MSPQQIPLVGLGDRSFADRLPPAQSPRSGVTASPATIILSRVEYDPNGGCWLWSGTVRPDGYGVVHVGGVRHRAHRVSYAAFVGDIPDGMHACHKCDVRSCVNPGHLFLGTDADNHRDRDDKGRRGARSKISDEQVAAIRAARAAGHRVKDLAAEYGLSRLTVNDYLSGRRRGPIPAVHAIPASPDSEAGQ